MYKFVPYMFLQSNATIEAVIRKYNNMISDREELDRLVKAFNDANPDALPPKPGQRCQIPVLEEFADEEQVTAGERTYEKYEDGSQ